MGPTGTGKSGLALEIARARPAVIINADAMQMVDALRIITARPTEAEERQAEHALYGVLDAREPTSVALWLELVRPVIDRAWAQGKLPLLVGGTGMYIKALMEGLSRMPTIADAIREEVRELTTEQAYAALEEEDPQMASRLKRGDTQRILRALEVMRGTGTSLAEWQEQTGEPTFPKATYHMFHTELPREEVYARIDRRFELMIEQGALEEVKALMELHLPLSIPIMRAHGVPELMAHLKGEMELKKAISKGQQNTRNYAKRQLTWLRQQAKNSVSIQMDNPSERAEGLARMTKL